MRILALEVERFGALTGRRFDLDGDAFVLEGPNEAGKSSFHQAIETVFYGFQPATREAHPYTSFGDQRAPLRIVAQLAAADGRRFAVERRLGASASLRRAPDGAPFTGPAERNLPLSELQAIPRSLFRAVHSLTANEVREPDAAGLQDLIDELLLGDNLAVGMRPLRVLRQEVSSERSRLWRRDLRGETRARSLTRALAELRSAARAAADEQRTLADDEARLAEVRRRIAEVRRLHGAAEVAAQDEALLAELTKLARAERALAAVDLSGFEGTDLLGGAGSAGVPFEDPDVAAAAVDRARAALAPHAARLAEPPVALDAALRALLARGSAIERLAQDELEGRDDDRERQRLAAQVDEALQRAVDFAAGQSAELALELGGYASALRDVVHDEESLGPRLDPFDAVPLDALRAAALAWRDRAEEARSARPVALALRGPALTAMVIGLVLVALEHSGRATPEVGWVGLAVAALGVIGARVGARRRADGSSPPPELVEVARAAGLGPTSLLRPAALLDALGALDEAREAVRLAQRAAEEAVRLDSRRAARRERWRSLATGVPGADGGPRLIDTTPLAALPAALRDGLRRALRQQELAARDSQERSAAERAHADALRALQAAELRRERLGAALRRAVPSVADPAEAFRALQALGRERAALLGERRALARHPRYAALAEDPRLAAWSPAEARAAARCAELRAELEALRQEEGGLAERLAAPRGRAPAELAAEAAAVEAELSAVRRAHDRLALLERALAVGERRHRAAHQPDVLRAASEHLARITGGRYGRIGYPDAERRVLCVRSAELDADVPVGPPLSRGVREQVHLCLRLGTLEHLDRGREPLPLVLDEALVHWDPARRAALYPTLRALTAQRQVITLTCQPELAAEFVREVGGRAVALAGR